jgi:hypothetical protein
MPKTCVERLSGDRRGIRQVSRIDDIFKSLIEAGHNHIHRAAVLRVLHPQSMLQGWVTMGMKD